MGIALCAKNQNPGNYSNPSLRSLVLAPMTLALALAPVFRRQHGEPSCSADLWALILMHYVLSFIQFRDTQNLFNKLIPFGPLQSTMFFFTFKTIPTFAF